MSSAGGENDVPRFGFCRNVTAIEFRESRCCRESPASISIRSVTVTPVTPTALPRPPAAGALSLLALVPSRQAQGRPILPPPLFGECRQRLGPKSARPSGSCPPPLSVLVARAQAMIAPMQAAWPQMPANPFAFGQRLNGGIKTQSGSQNMCAPDGGCKPAGDLIHLHRGSDANEPTPKIHNLPHGCLCRCHCASACRR
jgi:hypothetical protein